MNARLACHWAVTATAALLLGALLSTLVAGDTASYVVILAAAGVGMTGLATAPHIRKEPRP